MRTSIILALASLMLNMTEAIKTTAADSVYIDSDHPFHLNTSIHREGDCSDNMLQVVWEPFTICDERWCARPFTGAEIPCRATLEVAYVDYAHGEIRTKTIVGDGICVNVKDHIKYGGGYDSYDDFKIIGGNVTETD